MRLTSALTHTFSFFPGNYRWSAEMLTTLSAAQYGGADVSEVLRIGTSLRDQVGNDEAWFDTWIKAAHLRISTAQAAEADEHPLTAASHYLRACFYAQIVDHARQPKDEIALAEYQKSLDCFRKFAALTNRPKIAVVELPSKAGSFPAYFVHAKNTSGRAPCVVRFGGFDTQKELQYLCGVPDMVRRGLSHLLVDGPGQREAIRFRGMPMRYDFDVAGSAALDYLQTRNGVDMMRVAILAMSLGGYCALRGDGHTLQRVHRVGRDLGLSSHPGQAYQGAEGRRAAGASRTSAVGNRRRDLRRSAEKT